MSPAAED